MMPLLGAVQGLAGIAGGMIGSGKRKREQAAAQAEYNRNKARMENADTSNLYKNQENVYEDLTVNTQEADFIAQQQNQGMANTMGSLRQSAGGSGIAALAQSLAGQQAQNAQMASASIGQQEQRNQMLAAQETSRLQGLEIGGEAQSRGLEAQLMSERAQIDAGELAQSEAQIQAARQARTQALGQFAGGVGDVLTGGLNFGDFSSMLGNNPVELATKTGSVTPQGSTPGLTLAPIFKPK